MSWGADGDGGGDDEECGSFSPQRPPTFTSLLLLLFHLLHLLLVLLFSMSLKRNSMQMSSGEDKIPVSTALSVAVCTLCC